MFRLLIWVLLIYIAIKVAKTVMRMLSRPAEPQDQVHEDTRNDIGRKPYKIDQKDVVDAKFEEIRENKDKKTGE